MTDYLDSLEPETRAFVRAVLSDLRDEGYEAHLVSGRRTCAEQNALYAQGRTAPGPIVTHARGCQSWHVQGRAADVVITPPSGYQRLGQIAIGRGGVWGGTFPKLRDVGHIEYHPGLTIEQACPSPDECGGAPVLSSPHAEALEQIRTAERALGAWLDWPAELNVLGVSWFETRHGTQLPGHNWGAAQGGRPGPAGCPPGTSPGTDRDAKGVPYDACFQTFPTREDGARAFLALLLRRPTIGPFLRAGGGSAAAMAHAMKLDRYYELAEGAYASRLEGSMAKVRAGLPGRDGVRLAGGLLASAIASALVGVWGAS